MLEFKRTFYPDGELPFLWHYMPILDKETEKPIPIPQDEKLPTPASDFWESLFEETVRDAIGCRPDVNTSVFAKQKAVQKIALEIGSGKGAFLSSYAQKHPEIFILGAEWDTSCANLTAKKLRQLKINNARIMRGDLYFFVRDLVPSNSIDEIHMYFPDPWEKRRQNKNRLILRNGFLEQIYRTFKIGKRIFYWATDHAEYNALALQAFRNFSHAKILVENSAAPTEGIETGFERKYKKEGRPIYRSIIEFEKPEA